MPEFLTQPDLPYCKGCGHRLIARNTVRALEQLALSPRDVVLVTDIGCHGIVGRNFATHTIHGLHGRSVALGAGIAMGLPTGKKVVVFIGDGGATIGLQHLLEAARLNVDLCVVVHNNMLYGMTGGQPSGLTPPGFCTVIDPQGHALPHHDLCQLTHDAGAPYARRVLGRGDFSAAIHEALTCEGFALVEVLELCPSHGVKRNPALRLRELAQDAGYALRTWTGERRPAFRPPRREGHPSLLAGEGVSARFEASLERRVSLIVGGSAGEGVQRAAELFAQAAMACGLYVTKKGGYPVTVGVGFSNAEVIVSSTPIDYHGIATPDAVLITSGDGLAYNRECIEDMTAGTLWIDRRLPAPPTGAVVETRDFRGPGGPINAALHALVTFVHQTGLFPTEALVRTVRDSSLGDRVPEAVLEDVVSDPTESIKLSEQ